jgi:arsenite methyltransferase
MDAPMSVATCPSPVDDAELTRRVTDIYREVALRPGGGFHFETGRELAERLGYDRHELERIPAGAVASFAGVGYHLDLAAPEPAERVLDLGSGSGTDAFLAAGRVGVTGRVVGVDMTMEQVAKAERLRIGGRVDQVRFVWDRIEEPAVPEGSMDVVISNGVLNLSARKQDVLAQAARALRRGGRLAISDVVTERPIVERTVRQADLWAACIAGAMTAEDLLLSTERAGFDIRAVRGNPAYAFVSDRARRTTDTYGATSVSLLAVKR